MISQADQDKQTLFKIANILHKEGMSDQDKLAQIREVIGNA